MIGMDGGGNGWILGPLSRISWMHRLRDQRRARGDNKGLDTKAADKVAHARAMAVGFDVALVPREAKGGIGDLDEKEVIVGIGLQVEDFHVEIFDRADVRDGDAPGGLR